MTSGGLVWLALREAAGFTQTVVSQRAGVNQSHYSQIERGAVVPSSRAAARLLTAFGIDVPALAEHLSRPISPEEEADWRRKADALDRVVPNWVAETRESLFPRIPADAPLSPAARVGLSGLMCLWMPEMCNESDDVAQQWTRFIGMVLTSRAEAVKSAGIRTLSAIIEQRRHDPQWDTLWRLWPRLSESQRSALVAVAQAFLSES